MKNITSIGLITLMLLLLAGCSYQNFYKYKKKYITFMEEGATWEDGGYNFMVERLVSGDYIRKTFYPDTKQMTHFYTYADSLLSIQQGRSAEWWDDGNLYFEGHYEKGKREGIWKETSGFADTYVSRGNYANDKQEGLWVTTNKKGVVTAKYNYLKGEKHGTYELFSEEGKLTEKGQYKNDEVVESELFSDDGQPKERIKVVENIAEFKGCEDEKNKEVRKKCAENKMLEFIYKRIQYPSIARENGVEGKSIAQFVVNKEGKIDDIKVKRGVCREIKEEVRRIIKLMPTWNSGTKNGEPVTVQYILPVRFKLQ